MATGDTDDIRARLRALLPPWFADDAPILDGVLAGIAAPLAFLYGLIAYARAQTRIATASETWLDLIALDFFGTRFRRRAGEGDAAFRPRILSELLRPRVTRPALVRALTETTGRAPDVLELWNPGDCGAYNVGTIAYAGGGTAAQPVSGYGDAPGGYGVGEFAYVVPGTPTPGFAGAGAWGSLEYPFQVLVTAYRPVTAGIPDVSGYNGAGGGYGVGAVEYVDLEQSAATITDDEIYATVAETVAAGTIGWTAIRS